MMDDGILLESVEGLGQSPFVANPGEVWEILQGEKETVCRELIAEALLRDGEAGGFQEREAVLTPEVGLLSYEAIKRVCYTCFDGDE